MHDFSLHTTLVAAATTTALVLLAHIAIDIAAGRRALQQIARKLESVQVLLEDVQNGVAWEQAETHPVRGNSAVEPVRAGRERPESR